MIIYNGVSFNTGVQAGDNVVNVPVYSTSLNKTLFSKNDTVIATLNTKNIIDGTTYYWQLSGFIYPGYFNVTTGTVVVNNSTATINITMLNDLKTSPNPSMAGSFYITISEQLSSPPIVTTASFNISSI